MKVPKEVEIAAKELIDSYGYSFEYLGKYQEQDAYLYCFPEDSITGFPFVYLYKDNKVTEVQGFDSLDIINHFENISE